MAVSELGAITRKEASEHSRIIINCHTPGVCKSDFNHDAEAGLSGKVMKYSTALFQVTARSTEVRFRTLVTALEAGEESNSAYMENSRVPP